MSGVPIRSVSVRELLNRSLIVDHYTCLSSGTSAESSDSSTTTILGNGILLRGGKELYGSAPKSLDVSDLIRNSNARLSILE